MIKAIVLKEFTSGSIKGLSFNDQIQVRTTQDLQIMDLIGKELTACVGPNYKVVNVALWDMESNDYITRTQAYHKLKGDILNIKE